MGLLTTKILVCANAQKKEKIDCILYTLWPKILIAERQDRERARMVLREQGAAGDGAEADRSGDKSNRSLPLGRWRSPSADEDLQPKCTQV